MKGHRYWRGFADVGGEVYEVRFELCEGPGEEEDHCWGGLGFCCSRGGDDFFEIVLGSLAVFIMILSGDMKRLAVWYGQELAAFDP